MHTRTLLFVIAAVAASAGYRLHTAYACGGCFAPPETITSVDSHRMVIALSADKTVLWDQIRYTGDPADFAWVLPVPSADTVIDVADNGFFAQLEEQTAPTIVPPPLPPPPSCPPPPDNWAGASADAGAVTFSDAGVDVYEEKVVGPYQTAIIGSDSASALYDWLTSHGYNVPTATLGVIQHYTELGSKFVALRLAPDQGVNAMQPIRVEYPGYMANFPLEMVTVGAYGTLQLTLWIAAAQRYEAHNYGTVEIPRDQLVWDFATNRSNYNQLFRTTIDDAGGRAWVAEAAMPFSNLWFNDPHEANIIRNMIPYAFVTRLRTDQLVDHLTSDLELAPSADASQISTYIQAENGINQPPPPQCPDYDGDGEPDGWIDHHGDGPFLWCNAAGSSAGATAGLLLLVGIALAVRRRRS